MLINPNNPNSHPVACGRKTAIPMFPATAAMDRTARMYDLFRGPHFTLLGFGRISRTGNYEISAAFGLAVSAHSVLQPGEVGQDSAAILDDNGHAHRAYEIGKSTQVLVTP